jgi:hypothetical protein
MHDIVHGKYCLIWYPISNEVKWLCWIVSLWEKPILKNLSSFKLTPYQGSIPFYSNMWPSYLLWCLCHLKVMFWKEEKGFRQLRCVYDVKPFESEKENLVTVHTPFMKTILISNSSYFYQECMLSHISQ